ncbi:MAG: TldD/PmbA family protein [Hyphomicrobiales bacterium]
MTASFRDKAHALVRFAREAGADFADVLAIESDSLDVELRNGELEKLEQSSEQELGLRVFVGQRQAVASTKLLRPEELKEAAESAVSMAKLAPEDPNLSRTPKDELATDVPDLDLADPDTVTPEQLLQMARTAEAEGLAVKGITATDGARASAGARRVGIVTSDGFDGWYRKTSRHVDVSVIAAGKAGGMERGYEWTSATHLADLEDAAAIGRKAGAFAARRIDARQPPSARVPVIYDQRVATGLVSSLLSAVSGDSIARGTSFLKDRLGEALFPEDVQITDQGLQRRALGSKPFDAEGRPVRAETRVIEGGRLLGWLLDNRSAKMLHLASTGHASRGPGSVPSPSAHNVILTAGKESVEDMIRAVGTGLLVTELFGMGVNLVTGDYSRGASGFWIENGECAYPVSGITVASNLIDMFKSLTPATDLRNFGRMSCPSVRIAEMTIAGAGKPGA